MVNLQSSDVLHLPLLGGGLPVVGIAIQAPFVLAAVVISLAVQVPFHALMLEDSWDDCSSSSHGSINGEEVKKCQEEN